MPRPPQILAERAVFYGLTTSHDIRLVNQDHPFPYLVEQEERWHAALLANTSHGALVRLLTSMDENPNLMSNAIRTTASLDLSGLDEKVPKRIDIAIRHAGALLSAHARQVHEAFASYLSYVSYASKLPSDRDRLSAYLADAKIHYPLLAFIERLCGDPTDSSIAARSITTAYHLAKVVLNTGELWKLLKIENLQSLADATISKTFMEVDAEFEGRVKNILASMDSGELLQAWETLRTRKYSDPFHVLSSAYAAHVVRYSKSALNKLGIPFNDLRSTRYLAAQAALLGYRFELISPRLYHHINVGSVGFSTGGPAGVKLDKRTVGEHEEPIFYGTPVDLAAHFANDPSFRVFFECSATHEGDWKAVDLEELKEFVASSSFVVSYPVPRENDTLDCYIFARKNRTSQFLCCNLSGIVSLIQVAQSTQNRFVFLLLRPGIGIPTASIPYAETTANKLSKFGQVVYWDVMGSGEDLVRAPTVVYLPDRHPSANDDFRAAILSALSSHLPLGVIRLGKGYTGISCMPSYAISAILQLIASLGNSPLAPRPLLWARRSAIGLEASEEPAISRAKEIVIASHVYDFIYGQPCFPTPLPFYRANDLAMRIEQFT